MRIDDGGRYAVVGLQIVRIDDDARQRMMEPDGYDEPEHHFGEPTVDGIVEPPFGTFQPGRDFIVVGVGSSSKQHLATNAT